MSQVKRGREGSERTLSAHSPGPLNRGTLAFTCGCVIGARVHEGFYAWLSERRYTVGGVFSDCVTGVSVDDASTEDGERRM